MHQSSLVLDLVVGPLTTDAVHPAGPLSDPASDSTATSRPTTMLRPVCCMPSRPKICSSLSQAVTVTVWLFLWLRSG